MTERTETAVPDAPAIMSDRQLRLLKFAVVAMGILLIAGFFVVIGRVVYLTSRTAPDAATPTAILKGDLRLGVPAGAVVRHVTLSGNRLAVHYDTPAGSAIAIVDLATGAATTRVILVPEPAAR